MLPVVVGHRGVAACAPENTIEGIRLAASRGVTAVEVDVTLTKDGVPVLLHDVRLDRTTNGKGPVRAKTMAEVEALDAGAWFDSSFAGAAVPRLAEVLRVCVGLGMALNLELKPASGDEAATATATIDAVRSGWPPDGPALILSSFSMGSLAAAKAVALDLPRAALFDRGRVATWLAAATELGCTAVHARYDRLTSVRVKKLKAASFCCGAYTVNKEATARRLVEIGVDYIISDRPAEIAAALSG